MLVFSGIPAYNKHNRPSWRRGSQKTHKGYSMNRSRFVISLAVFIGAIGVLVSLFPAHSAHAVQSVPYQMNFQGRLNDSTGAPMPNGTYNMRFRIYSVLSGGSSVWSEQRSVYSGTGVTVTTGGLFSVQLGSVSSLPPAIFNSASTLYLEVELPTPATATCSTSSCESYTEGAMTPRNPIASSPSAINSDLLDGLDSSAFATATGGSGYIQNQSASSQSADFRISGTGSAAALQSTSLDMRSANAGGTLTIGGTYAGSISLATDTSIATGTLFTILSASTIIESNSAAAFHIQDTSTGRIFGVDTSAGMALLGDASFRNGTLRFYNSTNNNTVTLASGTTATSFTLTLPTALGSSGQCLSDTTGTGTLGWTNCSGGGGGGSSTKTVTLTPEFAGAVLQADGGNNNGTMTTDFISGLSAGAGYKHNFYQWTTSQATAQDYDIIITHQLPSDFNATSEFTDNSWNVWTYVDSNAGASILMTVYDNDMTACANDVNIESVGAGWDNIIFDDFDLMGSCDFTPNSIITIKIKLSSTAPSTNKVRLGEIQYGYAT